MESSMNSSSFSATPIMSEEETNLRRRRRRTRGTRIDEQNTDKEIMGADVADAGMIKPQLPSSQLWCRQVPCALECNENVSSTSMEARAQTLSHIMEALADPNIQIIGLHCSNESAMKKAAALLERVNRRADRDKMFDVILKATVTNKPNLKEIQDEIAGGLNLKLDEKSTAKRASILHDSIKMKQKILVILCDLYKGIDLIKVGIPHGADHSGRKILLTSTSEDILSNQMHTQNNFLV